MADTIGSTTQTSQPLAVNSSYTSSIDFLGDADWFAVTLTANTGYMFDLEGWETYDVGGLTLVDPWLGLWDGFSWISGDDTGLGLSSRIFFTPSTSGTYYLSAEESGSNATGTYTLSVNSTPVTSGLSVGGSLSGNIDFAGDADLYSMTLLGGYTYVLSVASGSLADPFLEVLDYYGAVVDADDNSGNGQSAAVLFTPYYTDTYYVSARESGNNATGTYTVQASYLPGIAVSAAVATETDSGTANAVFTISLFSPIGVNVTVDYSTYGDLAQAGVDFAQTVGTAVIPAGATSTTVSVPVYGDNVFEANETFLLTLSNPQFAYLYDWYGYGYITEDDDTPPGVQPPSDTYFDWQWYLFSQFGVNAPTAWNDYTGQGIRVAVFDQGIDAAHFDLDGNLLTQLGVDAATLTGNGLPGLFGDSHATMVAGVIAAERNGVGIVGTAYNSDLVSIYSPLNETVSAFSSTVANAYWYARHAGADIVNDSWGYGNLFFSGANYAFLDDFGSTFFSAGQQLYNLASAGRGGLGTIVVQSAGNSYGYGDDTNLHNFQNSRYIITVAASDYNGQAASYSSPGASILVTAPGGDSNIFGDVTSGTGIFTTDRVGIFGRDFGDMTTATGTSFAAPIVSGVVALMLDANPNLGYRDVQEILAYSARKIGDDWSTWEFNGAKNWNGGGLHFDGGDHRFGFGLVDATGAVRLAESWGPAHTVANMQELSFSRTPGLFIPDNNANGISDSITVAQHMSVERVDIALNVTHTWIGDLSVGLQAPSGQFSWLLFRSGSGPYTSYGSSQDDIHFTFDTVADWGEDSAGTWRLYLADHAGADVGTFDSWTLKLTGKAATNDHTYIYTNEYSESLAASPTRATLTDTSGTDTLNAAAVTGASIINLPPGTVSTIAGASLLIGASTTIENAIGGDGNDTISGNSAGNLLRGMRGNDALFGGLGNDTLEGGAGSDFLDGTQGLDTAQYALGRNSYAVSASGATIIVAGSDGTDTLVAIDQLLFPDRTLNVASLPLTNYGVIVSFDSDFNADSKSDVVIRHDNGTIEYRLMDGPNLLSFRDDPIPSYWKIASTDSDFNGDHKSDLVLRHDNGTIEYRLMGGVNLTGYRDEPVPTYWRIVSTHSDFNNDGKSDVVLRHDNGMLEYRLMNGLNLANYKDEMIPTYWHVVSTDSDFNGDGKSDVMLRHDNGTIEYRLMDGLDMIGYKDEPIPNYWSVVSADSDFNGDGKSDVVLRNDNGTLEYRLMNGLNMTAYKDEPIPTYWHVVNLQADLNGDNKSDVVIRNDGGVIEYRLMDGVNYFAWRDDAVPNSWNTVTADADFNGDHKSDVVIRNDNGTIEYRLMDGLNMATFKDDPIPLSWHVAASEWHVI